MPSVLWRCWLGGRKGARPVKYRVVGCWCGCLSGARCRLAYGPADATATHCPCFSKIQTGCTFLVSAVNVNCYMCKRSVLFCSLAVLDPRVGHTMDVLSPIYPCSLSFWLTHPRGVLSTLWCCPSRPCVVFIAYVHLALFLALSFSPSNSLVSSWCDRSMLASLLWRCKRWKW